MDLTGHCLYPWQCYMSDKRNTDRLTDIVQFLVWPVRRTFARQLLPCGGHSLSHQRLRVWIKPWSGIKVLVSISNVLQSFYLCKTFLLLTCKTTAGYFSPEAIWEIICVTDCTWDLIALYRNLALTWARIEVFREDICCHIFSQLLPKSTVFCYLLPVATSYLLQVAKWPFSWQQSMHRITGYLPHTFSTKANCCMLRLRFFSLLHVAAKNAAIVACCNQISICCALPDTSIRAN